MQHRLPLNRLRIGVRAPGQPKVMATYRHDDVPEALAPYVTRAMEALAQSPDPTIARRYRTPAGEYLYIWYKPVRKNVGGRRIRTWP